MSEGPFPAPPLGMTVHGLAIPAQAVAIACQALYLPAFRFDDVRGALSAALYDAEFDFGSQHKGSVIDRSADRILQRAKREGLVKHLGGGRWVSSIASQGKDRNDE